MKSMILPSSDRFGLRTLAPAPPLNSSACSAVSPAPPLNASAQASLLRLGLSTFASAPPRRESTQEVSLPLGLTCSAAFVRTAPAAATVRRHRVAVLGCIAPG